jgi:hypothetical protein
MFVVDVCAITVWWGSVPFLCWISYFGNGACVVLLLIALPTLRISLWVLISVVIPFVFVYSCGRGSQIDFCVGIVVWMVQVIVWVLECPFKMCVRGRDANKHTQHETARMARHTGDSLGVWLLFCLVFFSPVGRLPR